MLAGAVDPFVRTRILNVLTNFRPHWRKEMKTDMPAGRGGEAASSALNSGKPSAQPGCCKPE